MAKRTIKRDGQLTREATLVRELRRRRQDPFSQEAADLIDDLQERLAIMTEGRRLVDATELAHECFLLSAAAGGMTGQQVIEAVMDTIDRMRVI